MNEIFEYCMLDYHTAALRQEFGFRLCTQQVIPMNKIFDYYMFNHSGSQTCAVCGSSLLKGYPLKIVYTETALGRVLRYHVCRYKGACTTRAKVWLSLGHYTGNNDAS